jgi:hypothetical protein
MVYLAVVGAASDRAPNACPSSVPGHGLHRTREYELVCLCEGAYDHLTACANGACMVLAWKPLGRVVVDWDRSFAF